VKKHFLIFDEVDGERGFCLRGRCRIKKPFFNICAPKKKILNYNEIYVSDE
jgi:hypothetical protein